MRRTALDRGGFTLIEMLIVIILVGILATIASVRSTTAKTRAYVSMLQSDLHFIAVAEESFFADKIDTKKGGRYTKKLKKLDFFPSDGVKVKLKGNKNGWSARATHAGAKGRRCAIYRGSIKPYKPATEAGIISCD